MQEVKGDLFNIECDAMCISTNGFTKKNGENVMGKGCAKTLADYFPHVPKLLGDMIKENGNIVQALIEHEETVIVAFPVKPEMNPFMTSKAEVVKHMRDKFKMGDQVPGWACVALINIIERSARQLVEMADNNGWEKILLPFVGCGAGELRWKDVKPVLDKILDDRFYAVTFK